MNVRRVVFAIAAAQFISIAAAAVPLALTHIGEGTTTPGTGLHHYLWGQKVNIKATPAPGWVFDHWEGSLAGAGASTSARMWDAKRATAVFRPVVETSSNALARYVGKADPNFAWTKIDEDIHFGWTGVTFAMTSQQWRDGSEVDFPVWEHEVAIAIPWFTDDDCVLLIDGGGNPPGYNGPDSAFALPAFLIGMKFAELNQVPNQPLQFSDEVNNVRTEDEILAYSLDKFLDTGDDEWPVHLAMVKSAVRAMDMLQTEFTDIGDFIVAGASKRGWATWLTAAVDPRVEAFAPLVIDILNMDEQVRHHYEAYGFYAPSIQDYVDFDLFCRFGEAFGQDALNIVDPYHYLPKLTQPKLILNATGDQFFLPDGTRFYLDAVQGQTHLRYVPNADHGFQNPEAPFDDVLLDTVLWANSVMDGLPVPRFSWSFDPDGSIRVQTTDLPTGARLWQATNPNARDFRIESVGPIFTSTNLAPQSLGVYVANVPPPPQGWTAFFVELDYLGVQYTTEVAITPDVLPFEGEACLE